MKKDKNLTKEKAEEVWYSRANDGYCGGIDHQHYNSTRYHGVNLHAFFTKGTVEFRLFNSTLHAGKIKAYIQFCLAVSAWAITSNDKLVFRSMDNYTAAAIPHWWNIQSPEPVSQVQKIFLKVPSELYNLPFVSVL